MEKQDLYIKYRNTAYGSIARATILSDLDSIVYCGVEQLPLIRYLMAIYRAKADEDSVAYQATIDTKLGNQNSIGYNINMGDGTYNSTTNKFYTSLSDMDQHRTILTAVAGTATGAIYAPGASNKGYYYWCTLGTDNTTNPNTTYYDIKFSEETSGTIIQQFQIEGDDMGRGRYYLVWKNAAADRDLEFTADNGQGTEKIYVNLIAGKATS